MEKEGVSKAKGERGGVGEKVGRPTDAMAASVSSSPLFALLLFG